MKYRVATTRYSVGSASSAALTCSVSSLSMIAADGSCAGPWSPASAVLAYR
jgi:hypothetical protein